MKLSVIRIDERGVHGDERVVVKVLADTNLTRYVLAVSAYQSPEDINGEIHAALWLPSKRVKAGDFVRIYSGRGQAFDSRNKVGTTTHRIFWGLSTAVFTQPERCAVVFELADWDTSPYEAAKK